MLIRCVCAREFEAEAGDARCPGCGAILEVRAGKVQCGCSCGTTIVVAESLRGKRVPCTSCPAQVLVPEDAPPAPPRVKVAAIDARPPEDTKGRRPFLFSLLMIPLFLWSTRGEFEEPEHWYGMITPLVLAVGPSMALHGLYDTLLKRDLPLLAFGVAAASYFAFFRLSAIYRRREEQAGAGASP